MEINQSEVPQNIKNEAHKVIEIGKTKGFSSGEIMRKALMKFDYNPFSENNNDYNSSEFRIFLLLSLLDGKVEDGKLVFNDGSSTPL